MFLMVFIFNIKSERRIEIVFGFFYINLFIFFNIGNL